MKFMSFAALVKAAMWGDDLARERGRRDFLARVTARRIADRLRIEERDVLCKLYQEDAERIKSMWLRGIRK